MVFHLKSSHVFAGLKVLKISYGNQVSSLIVEIICLAEAWKQKLIW